MDEKHRKRKASEIDSPKSSADESDLLANKTSAEILNELFESFAAFDDEFESPKKSKKEKKKKKEKHKHKHKEKDKNRDRERSKDKDKEKHKKKDRKSSSSNSSRRVSIATDDQSLGIKIEVRKEKNLEIKEKSVTPELEKTPDKLPFIDSPIEQLYSPSKTSDIEKSPELPSIASKIKEEDESTEIFEKQEPKPQPSGNDHGKYEV